MKEASLQVEVINYTPEPEKTAAAAARLCYSPVGAAKLKEELDETEAEELLNVILENGHYSTLEHISFTFAIEGISRVTSHQLVRHRIASYSQQSQRYVRQREEPVFIIPKRIYELPEDDEYKKSFLNQIQNCYAEYDKQVDYLINEHNYTEKEAIEDARYILPNAAETKIVVTMNARSLLHFFEVRCCQRAQWEIRAMAKEMLKQVKNLAPVIFKEAGPTCVVEGECKESTMSCGRLDKGADKENEKN
ncbi:FAD-dependent thymidylate synthase [Fuchsiella alkaliacetigena]|uniref:FAD-dependent thymidylate synthase n=1 Tax=Fuchsiella alkaliacetigena TaxID=957042 RepID=UPI00200A7489|nr:FAD-dependent thymidylate synthase [Fuchsiella alkaliacetigena]MCK8826010.1 FAD-dependent thymidylate synthase [Fuchsiella alkaliacetigena]